MTQPNPDTVEHLLIVADPETLASALGVALDLVARHGAQLHVLSCIEPPHDLGLIARATGVDPDRILDHLRQERRAALEAAAAQILPDHAVELHVAIGKSYLEIIRCVQSLGIDMVIKVAEPVPGLRTLFFGSTDQHLLRKCPCFVWLTTARAVERPTTIIAAVDLNLMDSAEPETLRDVNRRVLEAAVHVAAGKDAKIHVVHAWDAPGEGLVKAFSSAPASVASAKSYVEEVEDDRRQVMARLLQPFEADRGPGAPALHSRMVRGPARKVLTEEIATLRADLIVMGTNARTGIAGVIIGNTAEDVLNTVSCPVLAVKPSSFVPPIHF